MPYQSQISSTNPGCMLFLLDQSGSMNGDFPSQNGTSLQKAQGVADAVNRLVSELVLSCAQGESVRDRFHIGVISYSGEGASCPQGFAGLKSISELADSPLRNEERTQQVPDGAGGLVPVKVKLPVWFDPKAGGGTPMRAAVDHAYSLLEPWVQAHPDSFPPIVINITDGQSTDGDPSAGFTKLKGLATRDGGTLVMNVLLSDQSAGSRVAWPTTSEGVPSGHLRALVDVSSELPDVMRRNGISRFEIPLESGSRAVVLNGSIVDVVQMLWIGSQAANNDAA